MIKTIFIFLAVLISIIVFAVAPLTGNELHFNNHCIYLIVRICILGLIFFIAGYISGFSKGYHENKG